MNKLLIVFCVSLLFIEVSINPSMAQVYPGNAISFNGVSDYVEIADSPENNFATGKKFTIEFWAKVNSDVAYMTFVNKGSGGGAEQYSFDIYTSVFRFYIKGINFTVLSIPRPTIAEGWVHFAGTYDGTTQEMKLYKNGDLVASTNTAESTLNSNTNPLAFGVQAPPNLNQFLNGSMDEVKIWNVVRTQEEIQANMKKNFANSLPAGLVGYYQFENNAAADQTTNGNDGTLNGSPAFVSSFTGTDIVDFSFAQPLGAPKMMDIDGNDYSTVNIGGQTWMSENLRTTHYADGTSIPLVTDQTEWSLLLTPAYCWFNNDEATNGPNNGALYNWWNSDGGDLCPVGWQLPTDSTWTVLDNYLAASGESYPGSGFNPIRSGARLTDFAFASLGSYGAWWTATPVDAVSNWAWLRETYDGINFTSGSTDKQTGFSIRCMKNTNALFDPVNRNIVLEVSNSTDITNLTPVFTLFNGATATVNSVAQTSGVDTQDFTNPVTYTITDGDGNTADWTVSVVICQTCFDSFPGNALNFDGTDDYVLGANTAELQLTTGTVEAWINTSNAGVSYRGIVVKQNAYGFFLKDNVLMTYDWSLSSDISTGINLGDGAWHHVAMTFNDGVTNGSYLYVDGLEVLNFTYNVSFQNIALVLGQGSSSGPSQNFSGTIDEVRIWNVVRSQADIQNNMHNGLFGNEPGLVEYFGFDQGVANGDNSGLITLNDKSSNNNDGTLTTFQLSGNTSNWVKSYSQNANFYTFKVPNQLGDEIIDYQNRTINIDVNTDVTSLVSTFAVPAGVIVKIGTADQTSGVSANDFSAPVIYTLTTEGNIYSEDWTVTITKVVSSEANILSFQIPGQNIATLDDVNHTIALEFPAGTDITALVATFELSAGATAEVNSINQISGVTANDFTSPVVYTITAEDLTTTLDWVVSVLVNQTITSNLPDTVVYTSSPVTLSATASSGLPVTFSTAGTATITGDMITILESGWIYITISQAGNSTYIPKTVEDSIFVEKADQAITFDPIADKQSSDAPFTLSASSDSGLGVAYSTVTSYVINLNGQMEAIPPNVTINGNEITITNPGRASILASQSGDVNYNAAESVLQSFCILPPKPTITAITGGSQLTSSSTVGNQWYLNGIILPGATDSTLDAVEQGVYTVQVTINQCISAISDGMTFTITGINEEVNNKLVLYPNPVTGILNVKLNTWSKAAVTTVTVINTEGKYFIANHEMNHINGKFELDVSAWPKGLYNIIVEDAEGNRIVRGLFVIE